MLKVVSKGEECIIKLEDKSTGKLDFVLRCVVLTQVYAKPFYYPIICFCNNFYIGELYARAFLRKGELHPVEPVIDSSRFRTFQTEILAYIHLIICIKKSYHNAYKQLGSNLDLTMFCLRLLLSFYYYHILSSNPASI